MSDDSTVATISTAADAVNVLTPQLTPIEAVTAETSLRIEANKTGAIGTPGSLLPMIRLTYRAIID